MPPPAQFLASRQIPREQIPGRLCYRLPIGPVNLALGGTVAAFAKPGELDTAYGKNPMGYTVFAKLSLGD